GPPRGLDRGDGDEEAILARREKELRSGPAPLIVEIAITVGARVDVRRRVRVQPVLIVERVGVLSRPSPRGERGARERISQTGELARTTPREPRRLRHHRREVERGGRALLHDVARLRRHPWLLER